jgi:hypothetical protein
MGTQRVERNPLESTKQELKETQKILQDTAKECRIPKRIVERIWAIYQTSVEETRSEVSFFKVT